MKKLLISFFALFLVLTMNLQAAVTLRYYNKDSQKHTMKVKMSGSSKEVTFDASKTASVTIQGSSTEAIIETSSGKVTVKDGDKIEIKDGKITIK